MKGKTVKASGKALALLLLMLLSLVLGGSDPMEIASQISSQNGSSAVQDGAVPETMPEDPQSYEDWIAVLSDSDRDEQDQRLFIEINGGTPLFDPSDALEGDFERYSELDGLGRCGAAYANLSRELMPTEERGPIGAVKPSGWHLVRYDDLIRDSYLYNRCHLIGYQLTGQNANPNNLITGTRFMNVDGMEPFENRVAFYIRRTGNRVLYRVTPVFRGEDLVARGVLMEAYSVEDEGKGVCFCVFVRNIQPGIRIDYATGESCRADEDVQQFVYEGGCIGNRRSLKYHKPGCAMLPEEQNRVWFETEEDAQEQGYTPCGYCF